MSIIQKKENDIIHKSILKLAEHFPKNYPKFEDYLTQNYQWYGASWKSKHFETDVEYSTEQIYSMYKNKYP